jgi:hypothetical protein
MMQLRYVAIAVVLLAGCRKEPRTPPAGGSAQAADAAAPADTAPLPADAAEPTPTPDAPSAPTPDAPSAPVDAGAPPAPVDAGAPPDARGPRDAGVPGPLPGQGEPCSPTGQCKAGLACVEYYGIAGPRGPKFTSCEIRCGKDGKCPARQSCITIADGPGQVCRP